MAYNYISYTEKLKDPRWQKKRLEILSRDGFACRSCYNNLETLHVHHLNYISGKEPWEYPDEYFLTLCKTCHEKVTVYRKEFEQGIINNFRLKLIDPFIQNSALFLFDSLSEPQLNNIIYMMWEVVHNNHDLEEIMNQVYSISVQKEIQEKEVING